MTKYSDRPTIVHIGDPIAFRLSAARDVAALGHPDCLKHDLECIIVLIDRQLPSMFVDLSCNFDKDTFCSWNNEQKLDTFDWTLQRMSTASLNTGPDADHSVGTENDLHETLFTHMNTKTPTIHSDYLEYIHTIGSGCTLLTVLLYCIVGSYIYIETSAPRIKNDTAWLVSPVVRDRLNYTQCLRFWYNMNGASIGTLNVYLQAVDGTDIPGKRIWSLAGNQGPDWQFAQVTVISDFDFKIVIEGTVGDGYVGDIAIDDIYFAGGSCDLTTPVTTTSATTALSTSNCQTKI
ncbi:MLRP2-like protein [Mya arenaria]|uniref:MLRP2-like protein n=1 Tax=Mya arenaria TaxID=6604 RepID=A0ABY7FDI7_MYAAR|nr:MLRP2-like protein [Mya arenaria]